MSISRYRGIDYRGRVRPNMYVIVQQALFLYEPPLKWHWIFKVFNFKFYVITNWLYNFIRTNGSVLLDRTIDLMSLRLSECQLKS